MTVSALRTIDFITHNTVRIDASAQRVWPHIANTDGWHRGMLLVSVGPRGEIGERFHVTPREQPGVVAFHIVNVEMDPEKRRTVRLESTEGEFWGFASWTLVAYDDQTSVTYDVFAHYAVPVEAVEELLSSAHATMDEGLAALKARVEAS